MRNFSTSNLTDNQEQNLSMVPKPFEFWLFNMFTDIQDAHVLFLILTAGFAMQSDGACKHWLHWLMGWPVLFFVFV